MNKKIFIVISITIFFMGSCSSIPSTLPPQPVIQPTFTPGIPTMFPTLESPTLTVTAQASNLISIEPVYTFTPVQLPNSELPIFPGAQDVLRNFPEVVTDRPGNNLYYSISANIDEIEKFYMDELTRNGWEWVYTDKGESIVTTIPAPALLMEFKKGEHKLGVASHGFFGALIVLVGTDISGAELTSNYIGMVSGGLDLMGSSETEIKPEAMLFSSTLLGFAHPSDWLTTDQLMRIFETDTAVNYYPNKNYCSVSMDPCFITLSVSKGFHFDKPISIRVHPGLANLTLEEANAWRWDVLNFNATAQEAHYDFPENLTEAETLESIEVRTFTLGDGTPAIQRIYRWKQKGVEELIIGTYTLFTSAGVLVEFHTDFTSTDWEAIHGTVEQVIASIKISQ